MTVANCCFDIVVTISERTTSALGSMKKEFVDLWAVSNPPRFFCFYCCYFYWDIYPALAGASSCGE